MTYIGMVWYCTGMECHDVCYGKIIPLYALCNGMVWYGRVWYGFVWYGMVWYAMVWSVMMTGAARGKLQEVTG